MAHRCCAPEDDGERETFARADAIDQTSDAEQTDRVGSLEREDDPTVINFRPTDLVMDRCLEDANDLAIDVVDGRGEKRRAQMTQRKWDTDERGLNAD